jgi:type II secretory pathway component PulK
LPWGTGLGGHGSIIAGGPYKTVNDLLQVSGIGEQTLEKMRPFVKTDGETQRR